MAERPKKCLRRDDRVRVIHPYHYALGQEGRVRRIGREEVHPDLAGMVLIVLNGGEMSWMPVGCLKRIRRSNKPGP